MENIEVQYFLYRILNVLNSRIAELHDRFKKLTTSHFHVLKDYDVSYDWADLEKRFVDSVSFLREFKLIESEYFLNNELRLGSAILAEGAQGALLDIDFGSYPFVTSSNTVTAGACTGLGIAPRHIGEVFGIFKAYSTRVGSGPFPTELMDEQGELIRKQGNEFGSTTGRPRRCGWIDLPALKYSIMINGVTQLLMMKADVLNIFPMIKICTKYRLPNGTVTDALPYELVHEKITPVYEELPGWNCELGGISGDAMPDPLRNYIDYLEKNLGVPITLISTGPDRTQTVYRHPFLGQPVAGEPV